MPSLGMGGPSLALGGGPSLEMDDMMKKMMEGMKMGGSGKQTKKYLRPMFFFNVCTSQRCCFFLFNSFLSQLHDTLYIITE